MKKYFLPIILLLGTTATTIKSMQDQALKWEQSILSDAINGISKLEAKLYSLDGYILILEREQKRKKRFGKTQINRRPNQQRLHALSEKQDTIEALENLREKLCKQLSNPEPTVPKKRDSCLCNHPILLETKRRQTIACISVPTPTITKKTRYTIPVIGKLFTVLFNKKKGAKENKKL